MSNNLDIPALSSSQANKTVTVVEMFEALDAALTEQIDIDATLDVTVTLAQLRRNAFFMVTATGAAKKITLQPTPRITLWSFPASLTNDTTLKVGTTEIAAPKNASYLVYQDGTANGLLVMSVGGSDGIPDAPIDGTPYVRQDAAWETLPDGGGGIEEAPSDGTPYSRQNATWVPAADGDGAGGYTGSVIYRLQVTAIQSGSDLTINELYFFDEALADKAIEGGVTYAASAVGGLGSLAKAFDRSSAGSDNFWYPGAGAIPAWIQANFPSYFTLKSIRIKHRSDGNLGQAAKNFIVQMSIDGGVTFSTVLTVVDAETVTVAGQERDFAVPDYPAPEGGVQIPYDIAMAWLGAVPVSQKVVQHVAARAYSLPINLAGTQVYVGTNPSATTVLTVKKNTTAVATISIATSGVATIVAAAVTALTAGDRLTVETPSAVNGLADLSITFAGVR